MRSGHSPAPGSTAEPGPAAGQLDLAIAPSSSELPGMRSSIARWLRADVEHLDVVNDVVLAVSETAHLAVQLGRPDRPVVLHLRRTHSILVVEVTFHPRDGDLELGAAFEDPLDDIAARIIDRLADRVIAEAAGGGFTVRCTFSLPPGDPAPGQGTGTPCR